MGGAFSKLGSVPVVCSTEATVELVLGGLAK